MKDRAESNSTCKKEGRRIPISSSSSKAMVSMAIRDLHLLSAATCVTHRRLLTCAATSMVSVFSSGRLVPHPPDLIKWVKREGGFVHPAVKIAETDTHGLGLVASEEIPKGSDLISLPPHVPLRFDSDSDSDRGDAASYSVLVNLSRQVPEELWAMRLGLRLLQERAKSGSFWWPYISNLPDTYTVPIFFSGEDIKNLQYAPLLHQVNKRCRFLLEFDKSARQMLEDVELDEHPFGGQDVDASSLGWAMSAVSSRAFRLYGEKLSDGNHVNLPMMLPLVDMCNHSFNPNANIVQEEDQGMLIKVVAEMNIGRNQPLLLNYGCLNNDLFLLDYGFVVSSNPYDCIELKYDGGLLDAASMAAGVSSPNFSSPTPYQHRILSQLNLTGETSLLKVTLGGRDMVEGRLLASLRVVIANDDETAKKTDLDTLMSFSAEAPLGKETEIVVLRTLIALCVIALGHFPTKLTEDELLLKKNGVSGSSELALRFRMEKKSGIINLMKDLTRKVKSLLPSSS